MIAADHSLELDKLIGAVDHARRAQDYADAAAARAWASARGRHTSSGRTRIPTDVTVTVAHHRDSPHVWIDAPGAPRSAFNTASEDTTSRTTVHPAA